MDSGDRHRREGSSRPGDLRLWGRTGVRKGVEVVRSKYGVGCRLLDRYSDLIQIIPDVALVATLLKGQRESLGRSPFIWSDHSIVCVCEWVCYACMCVCACLVSREARGGPLVLGHWSSRWLELPYGGWKSNPGPWESSQCCSSLLGRLQPCRCILN